MSVWIIVGVCVAIGVMIVVVAGAFNLFDGGMPDAGQEYGRKLLGPGFAESDLEDLRFSPALRGYRMDEVDETIAVLRDRILAQQAALEAANATDGARSSAESADILDSVSARSANPYLGTHSARAHRAGTDGTAEAGDASAWGRHDTRRDAVDAGPKDARSAGRNAPASGTHSTESED